MGRRWTDEDIHELRRMAQRYPAPKIAELTNRSVGGVTFKAHQLQISVRPRGQESDQISSANPGAAGFDWPGEQGD